MKTSTPPLSVQNEPHQHSLNKPSFDRPEMASGSYFRFGAPFSVRVVLHWTSSPSVSKDGALEIDESMLLTASKHSDLYMAKHEWHATAVKRTSDTGPLPRFATARNLLCSFLAPHYRGTGAESCSARLLLTLLKTGLLPVALICFIRVWQHLRRLAAHLCTNTRPPPPPYEAPHSRSLTTNIRIKDPYQDFPVISPAGGSPALLVLSKRFVPQPETNAGSKRNMPSEQRSNHSPLVSTVFVL
ncbi:hypothetical protein FB567DRAFT_9770 [Paraphoma chrysanthemicola]|uniref:Uncharacterized protein n=1 Tax=Paraphoma chrysanthemicola TaxID=798071 RepID=A0A8K0REP8_9PLEO|nr:hypothetical protein FB567DRAFT_9770 [Paraphoma chrysanthemicola]